MSAQRNDDGLFEEPPWDSESPSAWSNDCPGDGTKECPADLLNAKYSDASCSITVEGRTFNLMYEEMVELLAAIRSTKERGAEHFEDARAKACHILHQHVTPTNY